MFSVETMSRILGVSRSGFYDWCSRSISRRKIQDCFLTEVIRRIFEASEQTYGVPRLMRELRKMRIRIGPSRIARLMRIGGMRPIMQEAAFKPKTTDSEHSLPVSANLIGRNFRVCQPNRVWVSDITYVRTRRGFAYLCIIIDLYSRRIVGWSLKEHMRTSLVTAALRCALSQRTIEPWNLIFHSDRGSQYASRSFRNLLRENRIISSMSAKGDCFDNACAESTFGTIKRERIHHRRYENFVDAQMDMFRYIEGFYNRRRSHSYLGYRSPMEFESNPEAA